MEKQLELFEIDLIENIKTNNCGLAFFSPAEAKKILNLSIDQVYYAIQTYKLDAISICGKILIPSTALTYYNDNIDYLNYIELCYSQYLLELKNLRKYIKKPINKKYNKEASIYEKYKNDYYALTDLNLPKIGDFIEWSQVLRVNSFMFRNEIESYCNDLFYIHKNEILNYLIDNELVNKELFLNKD